MFPQAVLQSNPHQKEYKEKGVIDSGCSRHMTGNRCYLAKYEDYDGGFVSFGDGKGRISRKGNRDNQLLQVMLREKESTRNLEQEYHHNTYLPQLSHYLFKILDKNGRINQATEVSLKGILQQEKRSELVHPNSTNSINTVSTPVSTAGPSFSNDDPSSPVNAAEASNAFKEHLFKRFSPF
ncbi:hypothetical protein Tco_0530631 [Tanacetum coccineum]